MLMVGCCFLFDGLLLMVFTVWSVFLTFDCMIRRMWWKRWWWWWYEKIGKDYYDAKEWKKFIHSHGTLRVSIPSISRIGSSKQMSSLNCDDSSTDDVDCWDKLFHEVRTFDSRLVVDRHNISICLYLVKNWFFERPNCLSISHNFK